MSKIVEDEVQPLGADCYLHCGMYNFEIGQDEKRETVNTRFSSGWWLDQEWVWKIVQLNI